MNRFERRKRNKKDLTSDIMFFNAKRKAEKAAIHEIDQQILDRDKEFSLDMDAMILWTLHTHYGFGKERLEKFYKDFIDEHIKLRNYYEIDDSFPERYILKEKCNVDVEALNKEFLNKVKKEKK